MSLEENKNSLKKHYIEAKNNRNRKKQTYDDIWVELYTMSLQSCDIYLDLNCIEHHLIGFLLVQLVMSNLDFQYLMALR